MSEEQNVQTQPAGETVVQQPSTETLENIAKEIPVDEQVTQFTARPAQQPFQQPFQQPSYQPPQPYIPDPVTDQEGYKRFISEQMNQTQSVASVLNELKSELTSFKNSQEKTRIDQDVSRAVEVVNTKLKVDPFLAEAMLDMTYKRDSAFQKIWDNRHKNPDALNRALNVVAEKLVPLVNLRQDPQLAENVRAAKQSQSTSGSTNAKDNNGGAPTDPAEFRRYWDRLVSGTQ